MTVKLHPIKLMAALFVILCHTNVSAEPKLNGMAIYTQLGSEQFIAAVFADTPTSSARQLLLTNENKAMEIRVLADKLYSGRFKRMWVEGIAINAGPADLESHSQDLADFTSIMRVKLKQGDILRIERVMGEGTIISINDFILGSIKNTQFFDLLLRTWVGPVPLSSEFKNSILANGHIPTRSLERFKSTAPSPRRLVTLSQALRAELLKAKEDKISIAEQEQQETAPSIEEDAPLDGVAVQVAEAITQKTQEINNSETPPDGQSQTAPEERVAVKTVTVPPQPIKATAIAPEQSSSIEDEDIFDDDEEDNESYSAASLLSQQLYISKLTKWTSQFVKYPRRAIRDNHQGSVRLRVALARNGKVKSIEVADESEFSRLNKAAKDAIKRASPYPSIPDEITGDTFTFTVPVVFRLN